MKSEPNSASATTPANVKGTFRSLIAWQKAVELNVAVYELTKEFPKAELFGLTSQMRRAAVSVASNIAEGYGRSTRGEYVLFLGHARGSNCELQTQLEIAGRLGFGSMQDARHVLDMAEEVGRILVGLMRKLRS
jgi:four helix bundle protein